MGDLNAHHPDWMVSASPLDPAGAEAESFSDTFGLRQLVSFPTRGGNTLDLVFSDVPGVASQSPNLGSADHVAVDLVFEQSDLPSTPAVPEALDWALAPWDHIRGALRRALKEYNPRGFESVDAAAVRLDELILEVMDVYVKVKRRAPRRHAPWWSRACTSSLQHKLKLFARSQESGWDAPGLAKYKRAVVCCKKVQRSAFASFQRKLKRDLNVMDHSDRAFWNLTKELSGLDAQPSSSAPDVDSLAESFATKMSNGADESFEDVHLLPDWLPVVPFKGFRIRFKKVRGVLKSLDPSKSANGPGPRLLKECSSVLAPHITALFRQIVNSGCFPGHWKVGRVSAIHKRGSVTEPANYRPVTVLNNLETVFEAVVEKQFYSWVEKLIPEVQFGFLKGIGTSEHGLLLSSKMLETLERRGEGVLVSLDVKGAFDRCWWSKLLARLRGAGMRGRAMKLLESYLKGRYIQVVHNGIKSSCREISSGVPQGARWSSFLWDLDICDLHAVVSGHACVVCYADDIGIWYELTPEFKDNVDALARVINSDLKAISSWGVSNKTQFDPGKTFAMVVSKKHASNRLSMEGLLQMDGKSIKMVPQLKLVGYTYDSSITWGPMIDALVKKARIRLGALRRLRRTLDANNMRTVYEMFIRSVLEYGNVAYMGAATTHLRKLDQVQHVAARLGGFSLSPLECRRQAAAMVTTLKLLDGGARGELESLIPDLIDVPVSTTRHQKRAPGIQLAPYPCSKYPLDMFLNSYLGSRHRIWEKVPQNLIRRGSARGWRKISNQCRKFDFSCV